jgi:hypothetical protein
MGTIVEAVKDAATGQGGQRIGSSMNTMNGAGRGGR